MTKEQYAAVPNGTVLNYTQGRRVTKVRVAQSRARNNRGKVLVYLDNMRMWVKPAQLAALEGEGINAEAK